MERTHGCGACGLYCFCDYWRGLDNDCSRLALVSVIAWQKNLDLFTLGIKGGEEIVMGGIGGIAGIEGDVPIEELGVVGTVPMLLVVDGV